ncbi:hypothetical protein BD289DRAFT_424307, partial [Coniella lustricola]
MGLGALASVLRQSRVTNASLPCSGRLAASFFQLSELLFSRLSESIAERLWLRVFLSSLQVRMCVFVGGVFLGGVYICGVACIDVCGCLLWSKEIDVPLLFLSLLRPLVSLSQSRQSYLQVKVPLHVLCSSSRQLSRCRKVRRQCWNWGALLASDRQD